MTGLYDKGVRRREEELKERKGELQATYDVELEAAGNRRWAEYDQQYNTQLDGAVNKRKEELMKEYEDHVAAEVNKRVQNHAAINDQGAHQETVRKLTAEHNDKITQLKKEHKAAADKSDELLGKQDKESNTAISTLTIERNENTLSQRYSCLDRRRKHQVPSHRTACTGEIPLTKTLSLTGVAV